jgi:hypothetical protein
MTIALSLALQGSLCTPMCAESSLTGAPAATAVEKSESASPCHETADAGSPESSGTSGCGHDCEGCGLFAQGISGSAKPAVPSAPALLFLRIPVSQIVEPQQSRIDLRWQPSVRKRSLPILHSSLLL